MILWLYGVIVLLHRVFIRFNNCNHWINRVYW